MQKLLAAILTLSAFSLRAATFDVTTLTDGGAGSLRQAILDANTTPGADAITFSVTGQITLTTNLPAITDHTAIIGPGTNLLTVHGNGKHFAFLMKGGNSNSISDLVISSTRALGFHLRTNASGIASDGFLVLRSCVLTNCVTSESYGGAVLSRGNLDAEGCSFIDSGVPPGPPAQGNLAEGAGIYNAGVARLKNCLISRCRSAGGNWGKGGGIYNTNGATLFLTDTRIENCYGEDGGGVMSYGTVVINNSVINSCVAYYSAGGIWSMGPMSMTNSTVSANYADDYGGGIIGSGTLTMSGCTVSSNRSLIIGSGISHGGELKAFNCTISQNAGGGSGSAIASQTAVSLSGKAYLSHCTIISNYTTLELAAGGTTIANSLIGRVIGILNSEGQNLIVNTNGTVITNNIAGNIYNTNPQLGPLQNNGGPTWTHALLPSSPAIDNGDSGGLTTDQRGAIRSTPADIGAYEFVLPPDLHIARTAPAQVTLSWASTPAPLVLQQNTNLSSSIWSDVNTLTTNDGTNTSVTLPTDSASRLFRLRNP